MKIFVVPKNSGIFISIINVKETETQISEYHESFDATIST